MRIGIAADHGGFELKEQLLASLRDAGYDVVDFGADALALEDDYPDFVVPMARAVAKGEVDRGVLRCFLRSRMRVGVGRAAARAHGGGCRAGRSCADGAIHVLRHSGFHSARGGDPGLRRH